MKADVDHFKQHFASVKERELKLPVHARISSLSWSCDGNKLAVASSDGVVRVWDLHGSAQEVCKLNDVGKNFAVNFHPKSCNILAVCDRRLQLYDTNACQMLTETDQDFNSRPLNVAFNLDGSLLAVGTKAEEIYCFQYSNNLTLKYLFKCPFEANQFQFTKDDEIIIASGPGNVRIISADGQSQTSSIACANGPCLSVAHCDTLTAIGSADATITIFSATLHATDSIARPEWPIRHLSLSHDHQFLAAAGDDRHIDVSCMPHGECIVRVLVEGAVLACRWHPTKYLLAYAPEKVDKNGRPEWIVKVFGYPQQ